MTTTTPKYVSPERRREMIQSCIGSVLVNIKGEYGSATLTFANGVVIDISDSHCYIFADGEVGCGTIDIPEVE